METNLGVAQAYLTPKRYHSMVTLITIKTFISSRATLNDTFMPKYIGVPSAILLVSTKKSRPLAGTDFLSLRKVLVFSCLLSVHCFNSQSKNSFYPSPPESEILGADQKDRGLWGREWLFDDKPRHSQDFIFFLTLSSWQIVSSVCLQRLCLWSVHRRQFESPSLLPECYYERDLAKNETNEMFRGDSNQFRSHNRGRRP